MDCPLTWSTGILADDLLDPQSVLLLGFAMLVVTLLMWRANSKRKNAQHLAQLHHRRGDSDRNKTGHLSPQARDEANMIMLKLAELSREICGQIDTRFAKMEHVIREADRKIAALNKAVQKAGESAEASSPQHMDPRHAKVIELHLQGKTNSEIASESHIPIGEVELIISLERSRQVPVASAGNEDSAPAKDIPAKPAASNSAPPAPDNSNADDAQKEDRDDPPPPPAHFDARA